MPDLIPLFELDHCLVFEQENVHQALMSPSPWISLCLIGAEWIQTLHYLYSAEWVSLCFNLLINWVVMPGKLERSLISTPLSVNFFIIVGISFSNSEAQRYLAFLLRPRRALQRPVWWTLTALSQRDQQRSNVRGLNQTGHKFFKKICKQSEAV